LGLLKQAVMNQGPGMPESDPPIIQILLYAALGMLVILFGMVLFIHRRLSRIERNLTQESARRAESATAPGVEETSPGGAFERFLREDPSRKGLPKGEQFAEYRRWRQERGLNWTKS